VTITCQPINGVSGSPADTAQQSRQAWSAHISGPSTRPLGAYSGRRNAASFLTTISGSTITVGPGAAIIDPGFTLHQGPYEYSSDANTTWTLTAANATNPRIDIIYIQVDDTDIDSSGLRAPKPPQYLAGTAAATPGIPGTPVRSLRLCTINVPASGGGSPTVTMDQVFSVANGGIMPVPSGSGYPGSPLEGQYVDDAALDRPMRWNGTAWAPIAGVQIGQVSGGALFGTYTGQPTRVIGSQVASLAVNGSGFCRFTFPFTVTGVLTASIYGWSGTFPLVGSASAATSTTMDAKIWNGGTAVVSTTANLAYQALIW
jgi:hypothetical protein